MTFPGAKLLPGRHRVFLGMGQMLPGTPELLLGAFLLLGKTHRFPGTLKQFLGISIAPVRVGSWRDEHKLCGDGISCQNHDIMTMVAVEGST